MILYAGNMEVRFIENSQDVSFIVLKDEMERFEKIAVRFFKRLLPLVKLVNPVAKRTIIDDHFFFKEAPTAILIVSKDKANGGLAAANMSLMAEACGLGILYSGFFSMAANRSRFLHGKLSLNRKDQVVMTLALGYPSVVYRRTAQKETASVRYL